MSVDVLIVVQGRGRVLSVPESLRAEGTTYGRSLSYALDMLEELSQQLGKRSFLDYFVDADAIQGAIIDDLGEPEGDEEELEHERLFFERAHYHSSSAALSHVRALIEHLTENEATVGLKLQSSFKGSYRGTLWDLRVLAAVLEDSEREGRGFFLWSL